MTYQEAIAAQDAIERAKESGLALARLRAASNVASMRLLDLTQALPVFLPDDTTEDADNGNVAP